MGSRSCVPLALLLAAALAACGDEAGGGDPVAGDRVPPGVVAVVGDREITDDELRRHVEFIRLTYRSAPDKPSRRQLEQQALERLLTQAAIGQEAEQQGIRISPAEQRKGFLAGKRGLKQPGLTNEQAYRAVVGPLTDKDFSDQLLAAELTERLTTRARKRGADPMRYFESIPERWRKQTACAPDYRSICGGAG